MADTYLVAAGFVQKFKDKPAVSERDVNGQTVRDITIKTVSQKLVRITIWPELLAPEIKEGYWVACEGKYSASGDNNQFHNVSAYRMVVQAGAGRTERDVVNQAPASVVTTDTPATTEVASPF